METNNKKAMVGRSALIIGMTGLVITLAVNLSGIYAFEKPAASFFSNNWWSEWFPGYIAWFVLLVVGFGLRTKSQTPAQAQSQE
jgi:FtsH-binding integral membrane protein